MGRGRQKAKQQKIARKLKYLTTDTDYDELAKELNAQEVGTGSFDPFADVEDDDHMVDTATEASDVQPDSSATSQDDDLDEYAKWAAEAAEAAAKATSSETSATSAASAPKAAPKPHRPIPMPMPSALKPKKA